MLHMKEILYLVTSLTPEFIFSLTYVTEFTYSVAFTRNTSSVMLCVIVSKL